MARDGAGVYYPARIVMAHSRLPEPQGFGSLPKVEQVEYVQDLWDRIAEQPHDLPVPDSHRALVRARLDQHTRTPERIRPAEEILDRLAKRAR